MRSLTPIALLVLACLACGTERPPATPPDPDTSGYEAPVVDKIRAEREAVLATPRSAEAWGRLGMTFDAHHLVHEAKSCYAEAERLAPNDWQWPYRRAVVMFDAPPEEVLEPLLRAHELEPDIPTLNLRIGLQLLRLDRAEEAGRYLRRAHELKPRDAHALLGLGRVALRLGELEDAGAHLERAAELRPRHREIHVLLARVYQQIGDPEKAQASADRAKRLTHNTPISDPIGRDILEHGMSSFHFAMRGRDLMRREDYAEAVEELRTSIQVNPQFADVHVDLGRALFLAGEEQQARRAFEEANRVRPGAVDVAGEIEGLRRLAARN